MALIKLFPSFSVFDILVWEVLCWGWGTVLCVVRCLAASLVSLLSVPVVPSGPPVKSSLPWTAESPHMENQCSEAFLLSTCRWHRGCSEYVPQTSDLQPFSSPGTPKLITKILQHTKKVLLLLWPKKKKKGYNLIYSYWTAIVIF